MCIRDRASSSSDASSSAAATAAAKTPPKKPKAEVEKDGKKKDIGRVEFELFSAALPKTCENFRSFCTGERGNGVGSGKPMHYKGVRLHRIIKGFMTQGGDVVKALRALVNA